MELIQAFDLARILLYGAREPERGEEVGRISLEAQPLSLLHYAGQVKEDRYRYRYKIKGTCTDNITTGPVQEDKYR